MARQSPHTHPQAPTPARIQWTPDRQATLAEAVHAAVCDFTGTDGYGACMLYTVAGWSPLVALDSEAWHLQAGSARILADPPDGWLEMNGALPGALERGEFHCWLAKAPPHPQAQQAQPAALVDFSARHFQRMCQEMPLPEERGRIPYTQPPPPPFIWTTGQQSPLVHWEPIPTLCRALWEHVGDHFDAYRPLRDLVATHWRQCLRKAR